MIKRGNMTDAEYIAMLENEIKKRDNVYTAPTATTARAFCHTLPLTAHGHCAAKYDILDMAR